MRLRIGTSTDAGGATAVATAARLALAGCTSPALALVFSTFDYPAEAVLEAAQHAFCAVPWAGAFTPAILVGSKVMPHGVAVGVIDCDRVRVRIGAAGPMSVDARDAGCRAAREALTEMPLPPADRSRAMLLFSNTESGDASEAVHGALSVAKD